MNAGLAWGLLLLVPVAVGVGPAPELSVEFRAPGQLQGNLTLESEWALLVFHRPAATTFEVQTGAGLYSNESVLFMRADAESYYNATAPFFLPAPPPTAIPETSMRVQMAPEWGSLFVRAEHVTLDTAGIHATVQRADATDVLEQHLPSKTFQQGASQPGRFAVGKDGSALAVESSGPASLPFALSVEGLQELQWHGAQVSCRSGPCIDGGGVSGTGWDQAGHIGSAAVHYYSHLDLQGGQLDGTGEAWLVVTGGGQPTVTVDGSMRLPQAAVAGECGKLCPDGDQTLRGDGQLRLKHLAPAPGSGDRLRTAIDGSFRTASLDESRILDVSWEAAVGVTGAAVAVGVVWKLIGLFTRHVDPLGNPRRRELLDLIKAEPGLSISDLLRRTGFGNGALRLHLRKLMDAKLVMAYRGERNRVRYFENHGVYDQSWRTVAVLRDEEPRRLHRWLTGHPGSTQTAIIHHARQQWGWKRTRTRRLLELLAQGNAIHLRQDGRRVRYEARQPPEPGAKLLSGRDALMGA